MDLAARLLELTGATTAHEVAEGRQSRVFELTLPDGQRIAAKVLDLSLVQSDTVLARLEAVAELAELDPCVCRPIRFHHNLVNVVAENSARPALLLCFEFADGVALDVMSAGDAELMGETLARLHRSLAQIRPRGVPEVAALQSVRSDVRENVQLLHGDFNAGNLRRTGSTVKVFDFEDCGYGPPSFDIANALYMVLFDATIGATTDGYSTFEDSFLHGYESVDGHPIDRLAVDQFTDLRVRALGRWLDDLTTAPIGIRTATPQWHETLRSFVSAYQQRRP